MYYELSGTYRNKTPWNAHYFVSANRKQFHCHILWFKSVPFSKGIQNFHEKVPAYIPKKRTGNINMSGTEDSARRTESTKSHAS